VHSGDVIDELLTQEAGERLLAPHANAMHEAIVDAWAQWHEDLANNPKMALLSNRSRANIVYDYMASNAEKYFDEIGVATSRKAGFLEVIFSDDNAVLRFKKYKDSSLRTSGVPTAQKLEIDRQQVTFDGMNMTYLVAGYLPDDLGLGLDAVALTCNYDGKAQWQFDLDTSITADVIPVDQIEPQSPWVRSTRPVAQEESAETGAS
jgi:hypothetical protein